MAATTGYSVGPQTNDLVISYANESAWATLPSVAFQAVRALSESLAGSKKRDRPSELSLWENSAAVTTEESAGGSVNMPLVYGNGDDWIASALNADWQAAQSITAITTDMTITTSTNVLTSTLSTKFSNLSVGQWIRMLGWVNAANNGYFRVVAKASNQNITLSPPFGTYSAFVTETSASGNAGIRASTIVNSTLFKSLYVQKKLATSQFFRYAGCDVTGMQISGGLGQFLSANFTLLAKEEAKSTTDASTGSVTAAPTGRIFDPVTNFIGVLWNNAPVDAVVDSFAFNIAAEGAAGQYGMGSASAQGMIPGKMGLSGSLKMYFKNFTYYDAFKAETAGSLSVIARDSAGAAYAMTGLNVNLMNPRVVAGGPNQSTMAEFDIEGNPQSAGGTFQMDRLAAS
jgi:hypothetical protein